MTPAMKSAVERERERCAAIADARAAFNADEERQHGERGEWEMAAWYQTRKQAFTDIARAIRKLPQPRRKAKGKRR